MKKLLGLTVAGLMSLSGQVLADGVYNLFGPHGDKWGEISFHSTIGNDAVWV